VFKKKWNEELIISHMMKTRKREPLNAYYYCTTYPDIYAAAQRLFGSWKNAIEACGIEYGEIRKYRHWSKTRVVEEIKLLAKKREHLNSIYVQNKHKPLYMAAVKRFKSWSGAMRAAGIDYGKIRLRRLMSKEELRQAVLELWNKGVDLAYPYMRKKHQWLLAAGMKKIGEGSWDKARKRCGISVNFRLKGAKRADAIAKAFEKASAKKAARKAARKVSKPAKKAVKGKVAKKTAVKGKKSSKR